MSVNGSNDGNGKTTEGLAVILGCLSLLIIIPYSTIVEAWAITILWGWAGFTPQISLMQAALANLIVGLLTYRYIPSQKDDKEVINRFISYLILPWGALGIGWLVKTWM